MTEVPLPQPGSQRSSRTQALLQALVSIWWQPRAAVRQALSVGPPAVLLLALWTLGVVSSDLLERDWTAWTQRPLPAGGSLAWLVPLAALAAAALLLAAFYGGAALLRLSGRLLGGRASLAELRVALAWGFLPDAWALLYRLPVLLLWPQTSLLGRRDPVSIELEGRLIHVDWSALEGAPLLPLFVLGLVDAAVQVAGLVILAKVLGEANGFSAWRGLGSWLIAILAVVVAIVVVVGLGVWLVTFVR